MGLSEIMGLSKHRDNISSNEIEWWVARSTMKPFAGSINELMLSKLLRTTSLSSNSNDYRFKESFFDHDWYKDDSYESWAKHLEYHKKVSEENRKKYEESNGLKDG